MLRDNQPDVAWTLRNVPSTYAGHMPREFGSWLSGSPLPESGTSADGPNDYPGQRLGLPENGPGSIARFGRRIAALLIDWLIAYGLAALAMSAGLFGIQILSTAVLLVWLVVGVVSVRFFGFTPGQLAVGLKVESVDHRVHVGIGRALARGVLIALVVPALFTDRDQRSIHDLVTKTAVVRR